MDDLPSTLPPGGMPASTLQDPDHGVAWIGDFPAPTASGDLSAWHVPQLKRNSAAGRAGGRMHS